MHVNHLSDDFLITQYLKGDESGLKQLITRYEQSCSLPFSFLLRSVIWQKTFCRKPL